MQKQLAVLLLLSIMPFLLCSCSAKQETPAQEDLTAQNAYSSLEELAGKRIGVQTGTRFDELASRHIEAAQIEYFNDTLSFTAEYDEEKSEAAVVVQYPGKKYDPMTSDNTIAVTIVKNLAEEITHTFRSDAEFTNSISIRLK